jgi:hypothetical protein
MSEEAEHTAVYYEYEDDGGAWHRVDPHMRDALLSGEACDVKHIVAAGRRYTVNMATLTQVNESTGKSRQLRRRERATPRKDIQERVRACRERRAAFAARSGPELETLLAFVSAWTPEAESVEPLLVVRQIGPGDEFERVQLALGALRAVTVERVENCVLMDRFVHALAMQALECDVSGEDAPGVRLMFHGCRGGRLSEVQVMKSGLDPLYSARRDSQHAFGAGAYMSATADFSVKGYSYGDSEGARSVLVFLCVTGRVARGDQAMVERPPGVVALVDSVASPTIFSYSNAAFLYPAYRVRVHAPQAQSVSVPTQVQGGPIMQQMRQMQDGITQMHRQLGAAGLRQLVDKCGIATNTTVTPALLARMQQMQQQQQQQMQQQQQQQQQAALLAVPAQEKKEWVKKRRVDKYTGNREGMVYRVVDDKCRYAPAGPAAGSEFVPCTTNVGVMEGHSFAVGPHGLGYYDLARVPYTALAEPPPYYGLRKPRKCIVKALQRRAATKPYAQCVAEMARAGGCAAATQSGGA